MRNTLAFIGAAVLVFFGVGLYLGWYHIYRTPSDTPGHSRLEVDINQSKISSDVKDGASKVKKAIDEATTDPNAPKTTEKNDGTDKANSLIDAAKRDVKKDIKQDINDGWFGAPNKK